MFYFFFFQISMPESRLRGFSIIGITNNNIQKLPPESELLEKFPDLRVCFIFNLIILHILTNNIKIIKN